MKTISVADFNCLQNNHQTPGVRPFSAPAQNSPYGSNDVYADGYNLYDCCYNYYAPYVAYYDVVPEGYELITYVIYEDYEYWVWVDGYGNVTDAPEDAVSFPEISTGGTGGGSDSNAFYVKSQFESFGSSPTGQAFANILGDQRLNNLNFVYDPDLKDSNGNTLNGLYHVEKVTKPDGSISRKETIYFGANANMNTIEQEIYHALDYEANGDYSGNMEISWEMYKARKNSLDYDYDNPDPYGYLERNMNEDNFNSAVNQKKSEGYGNHTYDYDEFDSSTYKKVDEEIKKVQKEIRTGKRPKVVKFYKPIQNNN